MTHPPSGPQTPPPPPGPKDGGYTTAEAAERLGMKRRWLEEQVSARRVPFHRFGRSVRFFDDDIAAIKAAHRVEPVKAPVYPIRRRRAA